MADNPEVHDLLRKVGETPGFRLEEVSNGKWRVVRLPIVAPDGVEFARESKDLSLAHQGRTWENAKHDLTKRTGWSPELHAETQEILRNGRKLRQDDDEVKQALEGRLLTLVGWEPKPEPEEHRTGVVQRHGKGGTATGSRQARYAATKATTATGDWSTPVLADQTQFPPTRCELIGPDRATWLLERMPAAPYQRELSEKFILELAEIYKTPGAFIPNPADALCFDTEERNANGHHRLWAVIMSGEIKEFYVAYNVDPRAYEVMDKGRKRTTRDAMHSLGYKEDASLLGEVLRDLYLWFHVPDQSEWQSDAHRNVSDIQRRQLLEEHPNILASLRLGKLPALTRRKKHDKTGYALNKRSAVVAHYIISQHLGGDIVPATAWYYAMDRMACMPDAPGNTLSRYYLVHPSTPRPRERLANARKKDLDLRNLISAWNHSARGTSMSKVSYPGKDFLIAQPETPGNTSSLPEASHKQTLSWEEEAQEANAKHHLATAALAMGHDKPDA